MGGGGEGERPSRPEGGRYGGEARGGEGEGSSQREGGGWVKRDGGRAGASSESGGREVGRGREVENGGE